MAKTVGDFLSPSQTLESIARLGILCHPNSASARALAQKLAALAEGMGVSAWVSSADKEEEVDAQLSEVGLLLAVGGDGTILRAAQLVLSRSIPLLGINVGRLGFMAELKPQEALQQLPGLLRGEGWLEERAMLQAEVLSIVEAEAPPCEGTPFHALNDIYVGRGIPCRPVYIKVSVDGQLLSTYRADGIILATATGSTGYSLSAGGPVFHPQSREFLFNPVSPHLALGNSLVLPSSAVVELETHADDGAVFCIDGQIVCSLLGGAIVKVQQSPYVTRFLRRHPAAHFYGLLSQKLGVTPMLGNNSKD
ncbi:MAG: NAD(+)/NADH kinase [Chloroflexi bacterium]|nr:NAD(+)/NADH kinase [Chloroflexota bacterium]